MKQLLMPSQSIRHFLIRHFPWYSHFLIDPHTFSHL